jgi:hypothetical protein
MVKLLLVVLLFLLYGDPCGATKGHVQLSLRDTLITEVDEFGYLQGGTLSFLATGPSHSNVTISFCTSKEYDILVANAQQDASSVCYGSEGVCEISGALLDVSVEEYHVISTNLYYLLLIQCSAQVVDVDINYIFLNPGNEQLSLGYIPLPSLYISLTIIWLFLIFVCCIDWVVNKNYLVIPHGLLGMYKHHNNKQRKQL